MNIVQTSRRAANLSLCSWDALVLDCSNVQNLNKLLNLVSAISHIDPHFENGSRHLDSRQLLEILLGFMIVSATFVAQAQTHLDVNDSPTEASEVSYDVSSVADVEEVIRSSS
ncbi:hypothetical protein T07_678 [Trichinella nelsoni]|uniref:Uncharacterized protein n=1 Tax=Trichinella nelsoni TaxID=6336 RepID=A0A0V0S442_9BILA|nr:hypothetical protein T07_678 [Trichinella nelsoni]